MANYKLIEEFNVLYKKEINQNIFLNLSNKI